MYASTEQRQEEANEWEQLPGREQKKIGPAQARPSFKIVFIYLFIYFEVVLERENFFLFHSGRNTVMLVACTYFRQRPPL